MGPADRNEISVSKVFEQPSCGPGAWGGLRAGSGLDSDGSDGLQFLSSPLSTRFLALAFGTYTSTVQLA